MKTSTNPSSKPLLQKSRTKKIDCIESSHVLSLFKFKSGAVLHRATTACLPPPLSTSIVDKLVTHLKSSSIHVQPGVLSDAEAEFGSASVPLGPDWRAATNSPSRLRSHITLHRITVVQLYTLVLWATICLLDHISAQGMQVKNENDDVQLIDADDAEGLIVMVIVLVPLTIIVLLVAYCYNRIRSNINRRLINSFHVVDYATDAGVGFGATRCTICLEDFIEGRRVSILPICKHSYHHHCLRKLMTFSILRCPDCRQEYTVAWRLRDCLP